MSGKVIEETQAVSGALYFDVFDKVLLIKPVFLYHPITVDYLGYFRRTGLMGNMSALITLKSLCK